MGITSCSLKTLDLESVDATLPKLIFASAEDVRNKAFQRILKCPSSSFNRSLELVVVDESHTIETWTGARQVKGRDTKAFRKAYGELSILRSLCKQGTPVLALTGTADENTRKSVVEKLVLQNPVVIKLSPERKNIRFAVVETKKATIFQNLDWLIQNMKDKGETMEKTIIFCNLMNDIACVVNYLLLKLGKFAYSPQGSNSPNDCLLGIYHACSWQKSKDRVIQSFKGQGKVRVVIASSALSMGVNFPDVRYVVNWGPPRNILDFHQEAGRAGRDNLPSHVLLIYHGQQSSLCEESVKEFIHSRSCLRVAAYCTLDNDIKSLKPGHLCCSFCTQDCKCKGDIKCDYHPFNEINIEVEKANHVLSRPVNESDKSDLKAALTEIQTEITAGCILDKVSSHGFSQELITDVVGNCSKLFTVHDILETCPIFSLRHAMKILEIIQETFQDIPNFDETMEILQVNNDIRPVPFMGSVQKMLEDVNVCMDEEVADDFEFEELPEVWT